MSGLTRRGLTAGIVGGALAGLQGCARTGYPFSLGVASGEPAPDGVVLWTRLAPAPFEPGGGMPRRRVPVRWEIAEDESFRGARSGAADADPAWGHSVHVEVGGLRPDRVYHYRFSAMGATSPAGRTRTAPAPGAPVARLRIAFGSCQHYEAGQYGAYRHLVADDPYLVVFLGDYIYETEPADDGVRRHRNPRPQDLDGYRIRYATYKSDPLLQAAHRAAPWIVTWDDHEVADNYAGALDSDNDDPAVFLRRRAAAYQAYYEHMPLRRGARPSGANARLYRALDWGGLAQLQVIDDRQYRDAPACQAPGTIANHLPTTWLSTGCAERDDPRRSILGAAQEQWLDAQLASTRARWNLLAQQTLMLPYRRFPQGLMAAQPTDYDLDTWAGYPAARARILRRWRDAGTPNPLVLSGDIHAFAAGDHADPDAPGRIIASEVVGGSLTSPNHDADFEAAAAKTPGLHFADGTAHGYGLVDLAPDRCEITLKAVQDVADVNSGARELARFTVNSGQAGLLKS